MFRDIFCRIRLLVHFPSLSASFTDAVVQMTLNIAKLKADTIHVLKVINSFNIINASQWKISKLMKISTMKIGKDKSPEILASCFFPYFKIMLSICLHKSVYNTILYLKVRIKHLWGTSKNYFDNSTWIIFLVQYA